MAHFYGTLQGSHGETTRCGTKKSGITTTAASYDGAVAVYLYVRDGVDWARVTLGQWMGKGQFPSKVLYNGPVSGKKV